MPPTLRMIATDLDGTITGDSKELPLYSEFRQRIDHLRAKYDAVWVVCTGRSLNSYSRVTDAMEVVGMAPDYVILKHAYVYRRLRGIYRPHVRWNLRIRMHVLMSSLHIRSAIQEWHKQITATSHRVTTIHRRRNRLCLRFESDEACDAAYQLLNEKAREFRYLVVFRYLQEIDVRMVPFTKGLALHDLAERLGVSRDEILAIGNGNNDISMLNGQVARYTGCPGNAELSVIDAVHASGGHIAHNHTLAGTIDVLDAYLEDRVDSTLPEWWKPTAQTQNPRTKGWHSRAPRPPKQDKKKKRSMALVVAIIYALLTVFASFDLLPFSDLIMYPFYAIAQVLEFVLARR